MDALRKLIGLALIGRHKPQLLGLNWDGALSKTQFAGDADCVLQAITQAGYIILKRSDQSGTGIGAS